MRPDHVCILSTKHLLLQDKSEDELITSHLSGADMQGAHMSSLRTMADEIRETQSTLQSGTRRPAMSNQRVRAALDRLSQLEGQSERVRRQLVG